VKQRGQSSTIGKRAIGEEDESDLKHMRTAMSANQLSQLMYQIEATKPESSKVDQYFHDLKLEKKQ